MKAITPTKCFACRKNWLIRFDEPDEALDLP
jgi:hypothetical protein